MTPPHELQHLSSETLKAIAEEIEKGSKKQHSFTHLNSWSDQEILLWAIKWILRARDES